MTAAEFGNTPENQERRFDPIDDQYRRLVQEILTYGDKKTDPQGVGNISIHDYRLEYDLSEGRFPFLGLRDLKGSFKSMVGELLWIMSGSTNVHDLHKNNIHFWDPWANATAEWVEKGMLPNYPEGELGPVYGKQWRAFDTGGEEIDQLAQVM